MIPYHIPYMPKEDVVLDAATLTAAKKYDAAAIFDAIPMYQNMASRMLLTHSAAAALEMMAMMANIQPGDEIILPAFTYVATANAFVRQGAVLRFADIEMETLNIDPQSVETLMTAKTRAIIPIHYGGIAADIRRLQKLQSTQCLLLEDAAHTLGATYDGKALGSFGDMSCISFHESKNITSAGNGGALIVKEAQAVREAEEMLYQGTDREAFMRGEISRYHWQRIGSAFEMGLAARAFLKAAIVDMSWVTEHRRALWWRYQHALEPLSKQGYLKLAKCPDTVQTNGHIFYICLESAETREMLMTYLFSKGIEARTHYEPLHLSRFGIAISGKKLVLPNTETVGKTLLRLPLYADMTTALQDEVIDALFEFFKH
ncbi:aminotransferase class I/II-fold pyridoxal phosphate-dependent enzyme [Fusibacter paucivorans]|uniref:Aminotransferase class I/II-fold pyridoxal phosphate-dependent enzyme n=1 Tax=Fusibacter paucivorans TaxID=76009 RepID=A0ABS5PK88_9FIRM|nr:aminotransferase class I/II-fold pyridoxal phosphate-dependent enzyme [Fusibacter paucivorans]MBS7525563.1 aminotransferase class I/II-fold pyridoxal phosphate-dependent enzyme [Fusibacter paucivorans]